MFQTESPAYTRLADVDRQIIDRALALLRASIVGEVFDSPKAVRDYLVLRYSGL